MESKKYLTNRKKALALLGWTIKKYIPFSIVYWILLFISFPLVEIFGFIVSVNTKGIKLQGYIAGIREIIPYLPGTFFAAIAVIFSTVIALMAFSYMHNKRSVDLFGSFPVGRRTLFFARYLAVLIMTIVPVLVIGVVGGVLGFCNVAIVVTAKTIGLIFLSVIANVSFIAFISLCCGTVADTIVCYGAINIVYPICVAICYLFPASVLPGLSMQILPNSVFSMLAPSIAVFITNYGTGKLFGILWQIIFSAILIVLCYFLCKKRKAEAAQNAFAFGIMEYIIKFITCFAAGFGTGYILSNLSQSLFPQYIWFFVGVIIAVMTVNILLHLVLHRGLPGYVKSLPECAIVTGVIALFLFFVTTGAAGYTTRIPQESDIAEVSIKMNDNDSFVINGKDVLTSYVSDKDFIKNVYQMQQILIDNIEKDKKELFKIAARYYDNEYENENAIYIYDTIQISYKLRNGKVFSRTYSDNVSFKGIEKFRMKILESDAYNNKVKSLDLIPEKYLYALGISYHNYAGEDFSVNDLYSEKKKEEWKIIRRILEALKKDVKEQGIYMISGKDKTPMLALELDYEDYENNTSPYSSYSTVYYIPESYTNTQKVLEEYGYNNFLYSYITSTSEICDVTYEKTDNTIYLKTPEDWNPNQKVLCILYDEYMNRIGEFDEKQYACEKVSDGVWKYHLPKIKSYYEEDEDDIRASYITLVNYDSENPKNIQTSGMIEIPLDTKNKILEFGKRYNKNNIYDTSVPQYEYQWKLYKKAK